MSARCGLLMSADVRAHRTKMHLSEKKSCKFHENPSEPKIYKNIVKQVSIVITYL